MENQITRYQTNAWSKKWRRSFGLSKSCFINKILFRALLEGTGSILVVPTEPLWANPENSSRFFRNFSFSGRHSNWFLETSSIKISGVPIRFLFNIEAWVFQKSPWSMVELPPPEFVKYYFSTKCSVLDEFSRNLPVTCPEMLKLTIGWVFQKSVQLMPRKLAN